MDLVKSVLGTNETENDISFTTWNHLPPYGLYGLYTTT